MPGMVAYAPESSVKARVQSVDDDVLEVWFPKGACGVSWPSWLVGRAIPDLTDPATLGCLLALVREAWGAPDAVVYREEGWWEWSWYNPDWGYRSEAEALVAALEAAP